MSVTVASRSGVSGTKVRRVASPPDLSAWVRPADWLPLPDVAIGEQKVVGLYAVYEHDSNYLGINCTGAYTVNWGDGVVENFNSGVNAFHNFNYATLDAGTTTSEGYRQAIVTITPQGAGTLLTVDARVKSTAPAGQQAYAPAWLDIKIASATLTSFNPSSAGQVSRLLQRFEYVGPSNMSNGLSMFNSCTMLQSVVGTAWTAKISNADSMFSACSALRAIPSFDLTKLTSASGMFQGCRLLRYIPTLNTPLLNNMTSMFQQCLTLERGPDLDTSEVTQMASTFSGCSALQTIPLYDTAKVVNMNGMFTSCTRLEAVPLLDTALVTNFANTFQSCQSLRSIPLLNTASATNVNRMFASCLTLTTVPLFNTANVTDFGFMFQSCPSLTAVPAFSTAKATTFASMFINCTSLATIPALNLQGAGNNLVIVGGLTSFASGCNSLGRCNAFGAQRAIDFSNCRMSAAELNRVYTNLGVANGAQAIIVTGNHGTTADDPTIATAKGWTVTG